MSNLKPFEPLPGIRTVHLNWTVDDINPSANHCAGLNRGNKNDQENKERKVLQDNKTAVTTSITTPTGYQIPPPLPGAQHTLPVLKDIEESSIPSEQSSQGPPRSTMSILELAQKPAQDEMSINPGAYGRGFSEANDTTKKAFATDLRGDIMVESAGKGQSAAKAKVTSETEKGMTRKNLNRVKEMKKDHQNSTAATTNNKMRRTGHKITPGEILNGTERHQRILRWIAQCAQSEPLLHATMGKTPPPSPTTIAILTAAGSPTGWNPAKGTAKPTRPILGPKSGAGVTKESPAGRLTGQSAAKSKAEAKAEVGEGSYGATAVSHNPTLSKVPNKQIVSLTAITTVSSILKPKDGGGVTKKTVKRDSTGLIVENATTNCPRPRDLKRKDRAGGKKKTAAEKIWEENKVLMLDLEMLKRVDAELDRQLALYRGMIKLEDTSTAPGPRPRSPYTDTIPSDGLIEIESTDVTE